MDTFPYDAADVPQSKLLETKKGTKSTRTNV
jgi:hypothetical protein